MASVTFIEHNGTEYVVEAEIGKSLMQTALDNLVPGIDADCGGECSCATCHVMVDEAWLGKLTSLADSEDAMLDLNPERESNSRLSCQIAMTEELDGLVVRLPEFQF
jgi:2Fe-2S ferredoxin